jgi:N-acetylglucosamine-6-phosphate deacetylase
VEIVARKIESGQWTRIEIDGPAIAGVETVSGRAVRSDDDLWVAPAFWDIQFNGRWGTSFSDPGLTVVQVADIVRAQGSLGASRVCPTLITALPDATRHGLQTIAAACEQYPDIASRVLGIHLEGPYISPVDGYRGAHPLQAVRAPDWSEFREWQEASSGRIVLVTVAPEVDGAIEFIRQAVSANVVVAIGHTAADATTIAAAVDVGATLSTHLGNGIAATLQRHPNPIWTQAAEDRLWASFIADGHHVDVATLRVLARAKSIDRTILVSDASPLAGLPPGRYGDWEVDPSGKILVAGTPYLAGSNQGLEVGLNNLHAVTGLPWPAIFATVTRNPAALLGQKTPSTGPGEPCNFVLFRTTGARIRLEGTWVDGTYQSAD